MTAAPIVRAPRCADCRQRLELIKADWIGRDRAEAIAHAIERADWRGKPLRCIRCRRARHKAFNAAMAARFNEGAQA